MEEVPQQTTTDSENLLGPFWVAVVVQPHHKFQFGLDAGRLRVRSVAEGVGPCHPVRSQMMESDHSPAENIAMKEQSEKVGVVLGIHLPSENWA